MKFTLNLTVALGLSFYCNVCSCVATARAADSFDQRRQMFLDSAWADYQEHAAKPPARNAFWRAEALFELGKIEEGRRLVQRGLDQFVPGNGENRWIHGGNSGFTAWPGLDCYVRYERFLDQALRDRYRKIYTGAVFYRRLSTSNHKIMAAVTRYLATQIWAYFGGVPPEHLQDQWALRAATANYRLPDVAQSAGADRSQPFVYRALIDRRALYHFVNRTYEL